MVSTPHCSNADPFGHVTVGKLPAAFCDKRAPTDAQSEHCTPQWTWMINDTCTGKIGHGHSGNCRTRSRTGATSIDRLCFKPVPEHADHTYIIVLPWLVYSGRRAMRSHALSANQTIMQYVDMFLCPLVIGVDLTGILGEGDAWRDLL